MKQALVRRSFLKTTAALGAGFWLGSNRTPLRAVSPNERLQLAVIGIGGQGRYNLDRVASQDIVALCDVDDQRAGNAYGSFPKAAKYCDFRKMFDEMASKIDAVVISTPDHTHFHPAYCAMQLGKHVYLEKPMAHSVWEVRELTKLAAEKKVATQLGIQRHVLKSVRRAVELVQAGAIGTVTECYSWVNSDRGMHPAPTDSPPAPAHLKWDLWLGPAAEHPYSPAYVPYDWRFWWEFGTGEAGNWGCHILDTPFWALGLKYPMNVGALGANPNPKTTPRSMAVRFGYPAEGARSPVVLHWCQGLPPILGKLGINSKELKNVGEDMNTLFVGSEGMLLCGFGSCRLLPEEKFRDYKEPESFLPTSPGFHAEWFDACKGGKPASCNFAYSGPLSETVLLGNIAFRAKGGFQWDYAAIKTVGNPSAEQYIRPVFRKGWTEGLPQT